MNMPIFADTAAVKLPDSRALEILSADYTYAQYQVSGFSHLQVYLTDHRGDSVLAAQKLLAGGDPTHFSRLFNRPAYVLISQAGEHGLLIDLYEAADGMPINTLWIGACAVHELPIHSYHYYHYEPVGQNDLAFLSVYQNDPELFLMPARIPEYVNR